VKRRIILGTYVLSSGYYDAYYLRAQKVRTLIRRDFENAFQQVDAVLMPTTPTAAFKRGEKSDDPLAMYLSDIYTIAVNLAGLPAISIPCGFTPSMLGGKLKLKFDDANGNAPTGEQPFGLPIGMQLVGPAFSEETLFALGHLFEQAHPYHTRRAPLTT
jgi:aspartyl-tRNA(Asn)/glutamyl-tRNA(Gln) amidotransferase subunit A